MNLYVVLCPCGRSLSFDETEWRSRKQISPCECGLPVPSPEEVEQKTKTSQDLVQKSEAQQEKEALNLRLNQLRSLNSQKRQEKENQRLEKNVEKSILQEEQLKLEKKEEEE